MQKIWVRILTTLLTVGMMTLIFCFSMEPAEMSDATSGKISESVADLIRPEWRSLPEPERTEYYNSVQFSVRKCAHFTEFALLGVSLRLCLESWLGKRKGLTLPAWLGGTVYAMTDEWHQLMIDGRSGQWADVGIDSAGVLTGVLIAAACLWRHHVRKKKNTA